MAYKPTTEGEMILVAWGPGDSRRARFIRFNRNGRAIVNMQATVANAQPRRYREGFGANRTVEADDLMGPADEPPVTAPMPPRPEAQKAAKPEKVSKPKKSVRPIVEAREAAAALHALGVSPAMPTTMGSVVLRASAALLLAKKLDELGKTERDLIATQEAEEGIVEELEKVEDKVKELEDANETLADELKTCKETLANYHRQAGKRKA